MDIHLRFVIKIAFNSVNKLLALINGEKKRILSENRNIVHPFQTKYPNAFPDENW